MNFSELKTLIKLQLRENTTELDALIELQINMTYRKLARMALWPGLKVDDEAFATVTSQRFYALPYPFERILKDSLRYDVTSSSPGCIVPITTGTKTQLYRAMGGQNAPASVSVAGSGGAALYNTGTVSVANRGTTVTGVGTTFTTAHEGEWIVFLDDAAGLTGGDYGYEILTRNSATSLTLASAYRGPTLTTARYAIRPISGQRLVFDPYFLSSLPSQDIVVEGSLGIAVEGPDGGRNVVYAYQQRPARLYNPEDAMEVDILGDAVAWEVIANLAAYHNSSKTLLPYAKSEARSAFVAAKATLLTSC